MKKLVFVLTAVTAGAVMLTQTVAAGPAPERVTIVHVKKGCHLWSVGALKTAKLGLTLQRGDQLRIVNQDLDMHELVQTSGPATSTGGFMVMNQHMLLRFPKSGLYRFHTRIADMRGMPEAKTIGPDNQLVLTVRVR